MSEYNIQMNKYNALNAEYDQLYPATKIENVDGLNTALQNNDPRNWGLGANAKLLTSADNLDNIRENGWYWWYDTRPSGAEYNYCHMRVDNGQTGTLSSVTQTIYRDSINIVMIRFNDGNKWITEYVNPPMQLGVEYRTTERYLGKPVYVKVIEAGFNPAGTVKTTSDKTVSASGLVRFSAVSGAWQFPSLMYGGNYDDVGNIQVAVQAASDGIHVYTWSKTRDMTSATVNVSVYYTKD